MLALSGLSFLGIDGTNALLQTQERFVDLSTLLLPIFGVVDAVRGSLTACQVDKKQLAALFDSFFLDFDLADSMTAT